MDVEAIRKFCLSLPHSTEKIQWGNDLLFCIGGKMFTVFGLDNSSLSFKTTPEEFEELIQTPGIRPADYVARYHWVTVDDHKALRMAELKRLIKDSYNMVFAKLPKKVRSAMK